MQIEDFRFKIQEYLSQYPCSCPCPLVTCHFLVSNSRWASELNRIKQRLFIKGFPQVGDRTRLLCSFLPLQVIMGGHENHWVLCPQGDELLLKIESRHSRQAYVQDKTTLTPAGGSFHELLRGIESDGMIAHRSEQSLESPPDGLIIIYHIYRERFLRHATSASPDKTPR